MWRYNKNACIHVNRNVCRRSEWQDTTCAVFIADGCCLVYSHRHLMKLLIVCFCAARRQFWQEKKWKKKKNHSPTVPSTSWWKSIRSRRWMHGWMHRRRLLPVFCFCWGFDDDVARQIECFLSLLDLFHVPVCYKVENIWKGRSVHKKLEAGWTNQILIWLVEPVSWAKLWPKLFGS